MGVDIAMNEIKFGTIDLCNGETYFYREVGEGDNILLFIHGNLSSSKHWEPIIKRIPKKYKAYALDLRGMGESSYNNRFDSIKELVDDVRDFISKLNMKRVTLIGWSTGGAVAMELAADYPEIVEKLVLVSPASVKGYPIYKKDAQNMPIIGKYYDSKSDLAMDLSQIIYTQDVITNKDVKAMKQIWDMLIYNIKKPIEKEYAEYIDATFTQRNLLDLLWGLTRFNISDVSNGQTDGNSKTRRIKTSTLLIWGENDLVINRAMIDETLEALENNIKLIVYKNCGHSPITDRTDDLLKEITEFEKN